MKLAPLLDVCKRPLWHFAGHLASPDIDRDFEFTINGVKVRRAMVSVVHGDNDSEEAAELRHSRGTCPCHGSVVEECRREPVLRLRSDRILERGQLCGRRWKLREAQSYVC